MTWAFKRQIFYIAVLVLVFGFFGFLVAYPYFNKTPTCADGLKNGDEAGVDCGGSCIRACYFEAEDVAVVWARSFEVVPGRYNALAYLVNHNENLAARKVKYSFRFADRDNVYLGRREGVVNIPPGAAFAVFERGIELKNSAPVFTTFEFTEIPVWITVPEDLLRGVKVSVSEVNLINEDTNPSLSARVTNDSFFTIPDVGLVVILYDENQNAINSSSTYINELAPEEQITADFTWPLPLGRKTVTKEILPVYDILSAKLE